MKKSFLGKIFCMTMAVAMVFGVVGCNNNNGSNDGDDKQDTNQEGSLKTNLKPTIYLAGDSTVKTYNSAQYIGGWGQYLSYFLSDDITVVNAANGGRSSRSFINEGRLYNIENNTYSFSENNRQSIEDVIKAGDFLFIQFGHNDDDTNKGTYSTLYDRMVPFGRGENGKHLFAAGIYRPQFAGQRNQSVQYN